MKNIILASALVLGLGFSANAQYRTIHQDAQHTRTTNYQVQHTKGAQYHTQKVQTPKDPKEIARNKTAAMDRQVGLSAKQERKVYRMQLKEAKQTVKLQELKKENKQALKEVLTKEQMALVKKQNHKNNQQTYIITEMPNQRAAVQMKAKPTKMSQHKGNKNSTQPACCSKK